MLKQKLTQKNYNNYCNVYQLVFPIETGILIPEDDSVRLLSQVMEELDYTNLNRAYSRLGRNPEIPPKNLFKIFVYGHMNNIFSTRKIETACRRDINFIWLLEGRKAPDHNTLARFRKKRLADVVDDLFYQLVKKLEELGEIEFKNIFIDGTKIEANANKYSFVWKKATSKFEAKLFEKVKNFIEEINDTFKTTFDIPELKVNLDNLKKILEFLNKKKVEENIEFVEGKGKRKTKVQRAIEKIGEFIEKQEKYDNYNGIFDGRNSFSKTDKDATFMHMKEDHMRNSQLKPGYNVQIGVEGEYVVGVDISSERSDQLTLIPFLEKLSESLPKKYTNIVADAGYEAKVTVYECENCESCELKPKCTKAKANRKMEVSKLFAEKRLKSLTNITSKEGILLRTNRSIQVEGAFGVLKEDYGFRRFLSRGKRNVKTEFILLCFAYNINKLHAKIQGNRCGTSFYTREVI